MSTKVPTMKMTTNIPASITVPDSVESSIGKLEFFDGVPNKATIENVYDYLDRSRAVEAFMNCIPVMSMYSINQGQKAFGLDACNKVVIYDTLLDSKALWLTANTSTMYAMGWLDLKKDGPTVIDLPPKMLGILDDAAFLYQTDLGMAGPDKGKGGKFLVLPPGYEGDVPDGYFVVRSNTYGVWLFMRGYLDKGIKAASENIRNNLKVYPLSKKDNPPEMVFRNGSEKVIETVLPNDYSFFENLNAVVQEEPATLLGPEIKGQLAAIGIVKGKPFNSRCPHEEDPDRRRGHRQYCGPRHQLRTTQSGTLHLRQRQWMVQAHHQWRHNLHTEWGPRTRRPRLLPLWLHLRLTCHGDHDSWCRFGLLHGHGGFETAGAGRLQDLQTEPAAEYPGQGLLGADHVRHPDPLPVADRPAVPNPG